MKFTKNPKPYGVVSLTYYVSAGMTVATPKPFIQLCDVLFSSDFKRCWLSILKSA